MNKLKKSLEEKYKCIINEYIELFCAKHGLELDYWIGSIGGTGCFGDYYFNLNEIRYDIDSDQGIDLIFKWYDYIIDNDSYINYASYCKNNT